jgi:hypothetical protein
MTDLIERLRWLGYPYTIEAADEIERLIVENRFLFDVIKNDALLVERYNAFVERRLLERAL